MKIVVFDLGGVLVDYRQEPIAAGLAEHATRDPYRDPRRVAEYIFDPVTGLENDFDCGRISPEGFFSNLREEMGLDMDFHGFLSVWNPIFQEKPGSRELLEFLHSRVEMHLLSNTNVLHFQYIQGRFSWISLLDSWFLSYEMGCRKPDPRIYQKMLEKLKRPPREILFLDDMASNLVPALKMGLQCVEIGAGGSPKKALMRIFPALPWREMAGGA